MITVPDAVLTALIAAIVTLLVNRLAARREDRHRFADLKRERYSELFRTAHDDFVKALQRSRDEPWTDKVRRSVLKADGARHALADEIGLMAPSKVADAAYRLAEAAGNRALSDEAFLEWAEAASSGSIVEHQSVEVYRRAELRFREVARADLGMGTSIRERWRDYRTADRRTRRTEKPRLHVDVTDHD